ncbi:hypothetical protein BDA99DRAFT_535896 [Phascolomyces articulosus]|uniref:Uncharacterized protein n=1 Tax=Phascolomyces articulosus TaxID=60185 RepID=A0AAD5KBQ8_9FUNG|nr:hypothetical protein BDA99DRAFT_535896 [Phascolomyces articulosus]
MQKGDLHDSNKIRLWIVSWNVIHQDLQSLILLHRTVACEKSQQYQKSLDGAQYCVGASALPRKGNVQGKLLIPTKEGADAIFPEQKRTLGIRKPNRHVWIKNTGYPVAKSHEPKLKEEEKYISGRQPLVSCDMDLRSERRIILTGFETEKEA